MIFDAEAAAGLDTSYELRLDGEPIWARIANGAVETGPGSAPAGTQSQVVITLDEDTLLALAGGTLGPQDALNTGRVKLQGDVAAYERFFRIFRLPEPLPTACASATGIPARLRRPRRRERARRRRMSWRSPSTTAAF